MHPELQHEGVIMFMPNLIQRHLKCLLKKLYFFIHFYMSDTKDAKIPAKKVLNPALIKTVEKRL